MTTVSSPDSSESLVRFRLEPWETVRTSQEYPCCESLGTLWAICTMERPLWDMM